MQHSDLLAGRAAAGLPQASRGAIRKYPQFGSPTLRDRNKVIGLLRPRTRIQITQPIPLQLHGCMRVSARDGTETLTTSGIEGTAGDMFVEHAIQQPPAFCITGDMDIWKPQTNTQLVELFEEQLEQTGIRHDPVQLISMQHQQLVIDQPLTDKLDASVVGEDETIVVVAVDPDDGAFVRFIYETTYDGLVIGAQWITRLIERVAVEDEACLGGQLVEETDKILPTEVGASEVEVADDVGVAVGRQGGSGPLQNLGG